MPTYSPYQHLNEPIRFFEKVRFTDCCWEWSAFVNPDRYGVFGIGSRTDGTRRTIGAHRWSYQFFTGPIPQGLEVDHLCRNRKCVHPDHLRLLTPEMNKRLGDFRGNGARQKAKTHCPYGHAYTPENTAVGHRGDRKCRACDRERARERRAAKRVHIS